MFGNVFYCTPITHTDTSSISTGSTQGTHTFSICKKQNLDILCIWLLTIGNGGLSSVVSFNLNMAVDMHAHARIDQIRFQLVENSPQILHQWLWIYCTTSLKVHTNCRQDKKASAKATAAPAEILIFKWTIYFSRWNCAVDKKKKILVWRF